MSTGFRMFVGMLALLIGLVGSLQASAQIDGSDIPDGALDGAAVSYSSETGDDPLAPFFAFSVFVFEDDDAATEGMDALMGQIVDDFAASVEADETMAGAELTEVDGDDVEGLADLGDETLAYQVAFGDEAGNLGIGLLAIRDGDMVHVWTALVLDFAAFLGDEADAATVEPADPLLGLIALTGIGDGWFGGDKPDDGALIDQLPTLDQLPDGYAEDERSESLDEIEDDSAGASSVLRFV